MKIWPLIRLIRHKAQNMELFVLSLSFPSDVWQILQNEVKQAETVYDEKKTPAKKVRGNRKFCKRSDDVFPGEWIHFCYPESVDRCTGFRCESAMGDILTPLPLPERSSERHALFRGFEWIYLGNAWKVAETFLSSLCHQTSFSDVMRSLYALRISARKIKISVLLVWWYSLTRLILQVALCGYEIWALYLRKDSTELDCMMQNYSDQYVDPKRME